MEMITQEEKSLVGSLLLSPKNILPVLEILRPEDFSDQQARKAYLAITSVWRAKEEVTLFSVAAADTAIGPFLSEAISAGVGFGIPAHAKRISIASKARRVDTALELIKNRTAPVETKLADILELYKSEMFLNKKSPEIKEVVIRFQQHVEENRKRKAMGVPTGLPWLEAKYVQYVPGHIWTLGGFTSVGKTAVMVQKICNLLNVPGDPSVIVISTEMTETQLVARIVSNFTGIHSFRILSGEYRQGEEEVVEECKGFLKSKRLKLYDDVYENGDIETALRKADLQGGVDVGFIDYVQNCRVRGAKSAYEIGEQLSKGLQKLAKDVTATLICLSQVSNDVGRGNTDQLELKGAGEWAAVSDIGIMLQRHKTNDYQLKYAVKKNRHGAKHEHVLEYKQDYTRLEYVEEITQ